MKEKSADDVFQEAFEKFFSKKKITDEDGAAKGAVSDQDEAYPGERK
jgi:hypothetical protein